MIASSMMNGEAAGRMGIGSSPSITRWFRLLIMRFLPPRFLGCGVSFMLGLGLAICLSSLVAHRLPGKGRRCCSQT